MKNPISRLLAQEKGKDVTFTTMLDLYAIPTEFPGLADAEKLRHLPRKRVEVLERAFLNDIGDARFIPYIQLHEFEAYLLCDPAKFAESYPNREKEIAGLMAIALRYDSPELIDDGPESAPSKRIAAHVPDYEGAKRAIGPQVAKSIGLATIRAKCPHFHEWLARLEGLGSGG
jgi:hypothetical protein